MKVPRNEKTMISCICNSCPSYNDCMQTGKLGVFCSVGDEIKCFENEKGCNCQDCTVSTDYNFSSNYHCKEGTAEMQMKSR